MTAPTSDGWQPASTGVHLQTPCPLCGALVPLPDPPAGGGQEPVGGGHARCSTCHAIVPVTVASETDGDVEDRDESARRVADEAVAAGSTVAWSLAEHLPAPGAGVTVVDLGMGRGGIANALRRLGYTVTGCEPSAYLCQLARASYLLGPETLTNTDPLTFIGEVEARHGTVAGVVLWHVLDRHERPIDVLRGAVGIARGGMLLVQFEVAGTVPRGAARVHPTPATLLHLAEEFELIPVRASVEGRRTLRALFEVPVDGIVDLDHDNRLDLDALDAAYRLASPVFAQLAPDPNAPVPSAPDPGADEAREPANSRSSDGA
ncbi:MAG: hypothetical protein AAGA93_13365 [Actinomycetota bacterium]